MRSALVALLSVSAVAGVLAATRPQGTTSTAVALVRLPAAGIQPQVALDPSGTVHVVYFKGTAASGDLFYTRVRTDGTFAPPIAVNSAPGSAMATGNVRGARLAVGANGRVHVIWNGSSRATPRAVGGETPMLYTRMNDRRTAFEPQRNVLQSAVGLDGGGAVAADRSGRVFVAWHAAGPNGKGEGDRRVWVAESVNDGATFAAERAVSKPETGACGCCGMDALVDGEGRLHMMYRGARDVVHRDAFLLSSNDQGQSFTTTDLQEWNIGACPMSTFALAEGGDAIVSAWETGGQVQFARVDKRTGQRLSITEAPGAVRTRKHPAIALNAKGEILLAWTEGMAWQRGGSLAWQIFDTSGRPTAAHGSQAGVPVWSLVAAAARPDGGFTVIY